MAEQSMKYWFNMIKKKFGIRDIDIEVWIQLKWTIDTPLKNIQNIKKMIIY